MRQSSVSDRSSTRPRRRRHREPGTRASRACVNCKEKKLKCDEVTPNCTNCDRFQLVCLVEDPETRKQRPRNYLETLEHRLADLERRESEKPSDAGSSSTPGLSAAHDSAASIPTFSSDEIDSGVGDLPNKIGLLDVKSSQTEPQYLGPSSAFAFARLINSSLRTAIAQNPATQYINATNRVQSTPMPCLLPDYNVAVTLSNAYFENIHPQYPFLHEPTFREYEAKLLKPSLEITNISHYSVPLFFLNMVYAVGAIMVPGYHHLAEQLYCSAQLYQDVLSVDNIEAIQALLCYAMYSLRSYAGPSLWKLSGLAIRQCIELGYHRNTNAIGRTEDALQLEMRKRVFWCAQGVDCMCALRLGRPLGIQLYEVDAELPLDIDDASITKSGINGTSRISYNQPATSMSNAIHVIALRRIWARIHTCVYSRSELGDVDDTTRQAHVAQLRSDLDEWLATAPEPSARQGTRLSIFSTKAWYNLNYSGTILQLYRGQLAEHKGTPDEVFIDCVRAASNVCQLYRRQYIGTTIKYTWGTLHFLFLAGLTYLHCLWTSPAACASVTHGEVSKTCTDCTMVLVVIAEGWESASPYRDIFEVLASRTLSMIVSRAIGPQLPPATPALSDSSDREAVTQWIADINDNNILAGFDDLLAGFVDDFAYTMHDESHMDTR